MPRECPLCHKSVEGEAERRILLFIMDDKNKDYESVKNKLLFQSIKLEICIVCGSSFRISESINDSSLEDN